MNKYWIGVASREHVLRGKREGIAQVCHGKGGPLKRMTPGDWLIYYSPVERFQEKVICRRFTAIGQVLDKDPYLFEMSPQFIPWRRDIAYIQEAREVSIVPLIEALSFLPDKQRWGFPFRRGCFEISYPDFCLIAEEMGASL